MTLFRKKKTPLPSSPKDIIVPDGTVIEANGFYFLVKGGKKYRILSERILQSQNYPRIVRVTPKAANAIPNAVAKIGFRDGTVVKDVTNSGYYLISNTKKRLITSPDVFWQLGIDLNDCILASQEEILIHEGGENIGRL